MKKVIKQLKKSTLAMLALSLFLAVSSVSASAAGLEDLGKEVDGSILTNEESAEDIWQNVARGNILDHCKDYEYWKSYGQYLWRYSCVCDL